MKIKSSVTVACFLPGRAKDLSTPLYFGCLSKWCSWETTQDRTT